MFQYDESDPLCLVVFMGAEHAHPDDFRDLLKRWVERAQDDTRFGIILVSEPHDHDHEHTEEDRQHEAEITRIINDFRRDYRDRTSQINLGYARVGLKEWVDLYYPTEEAWQAAIEATDRFAQYNWGVPGNLFVELDAAKQWMHSQVDRPPTPLEDLMPTPKVEIVVDAKVGLFYGSSTGVTEYIADEIAAKWQAAGMETIDAQNIGYVKSLASLVEYDCLILGIPTWNIGELQDDWDIMLPQLDELDFTGKKVAIFGIGDQYGYPDNFLDAIGILGDKLRERGAELVGAWHDEHYEFSESLGFKDGKFVGLGIDEVNQAHLSGQRIEAWVAQLIREFNLQPTV